jgi:hypothetical protein
VTLGEKQRLFVQLIGRLIEFAYQEGYELSFGDAYRSPEQAAANAVAGTGIAKSLHTQRLAIDLNLFRDGAYLTESEAHKPLGEFWESLHDLCVWGGRFTKPDGNHYAMTHEGRR